MTTIRQLKAMKHYGAVLADARLNPATANLHYRRILDQIRCTAVKVTFEFGTMRCSRPVGHLNEHHDAMSGSEWS